MFSSLRLGKLFGIDLYVHATFWLLPLFVFVSGVADGVSAAALDVAVVLAVFGCVALHEVGHALAARAYGVGTRDITLYPVGGVARLERMPEHPVQEIAIALAGPLVNVGIAAVLFGVVYSGLAAPPADWFSDEIDPATYVLVRVLAANVGLVLFNLIPAFPMDGGRVLRAALSFGLPRLAATRAAVAVGSVLAAVGVFIGLFGVPGSGVAGGHINLLLVSGMVFLLGRAELAAVEAQDRRRRVRASFSDFDSVPVGSETSGVPAFTGWRFDPVRHVWSEWHGGMLIREVPMA